jgi:glucose-6-phosphate 1-dehydrogenase
MELRATTRPRPRQRSDYDGGGVRRGEPRRLCEETAAIRDVVENHMLQLTTLLAMHAPVNNLPEVLQDEKLRVFRAIGPLKPAEVLRGQYCGYREEQGVDRKSRSKPSSASTAY